MVIPRVAIGETHFGAHTHDSDSRAELLFFLVHHSAHGQWIAWLAFAAGQHDHHGIRRGLAIAVQHQHLQGAGLRGGAGYKKAALAATFFPCFSLVRRMSTWP